MDKYVVILKDKVSNEIDADLNYRHCKHLKNTAEQGLLFLCGPLIGHGGAMQIVLAKSLEDAESLIKKDPFISEGFYKSYEIYRLLDANLENNFLYKGEL